MTTHSHSLDLRMCETPYIARGWKFVCGTDNKTYDFTEFDCISKGEYGVSVNLDIKHKGPCSKWDYYRERLIYFLRWVNV